MDFNEYIIKEAIQYNIKKELSIVECVFRRESKEFTNYFRYLKEHIDEFDLSEFDKSLLETDIGEKAIYEGEEVFLDIPFVEKIQKKKDDPCWAGYVQLGTKKGKDGKEVPNCVPIDSVTEAEYQGKEVDLDKPKRNSGSGKKYYVYTKNKNGNVIKVSFGDEKGGLTAKIGDPEARKSFVARHNCSAKKDKTTPGYWSCRLPYYAKELGLSDGGSYFW